MKKTFTNVIIAASLLICGFQVLQVPYFSALNGSDSPFDALKIYNDDQLIYGDFDSDGDIDIHLYPNFGAAENQFWRNNGSGRFERVTGAADPFNNIAEKAVFYTAKYAFVADWDHDGDADIFVTRRANNQKNIFYKNNNGKYEEISGANSPFSAIRISGDDQLIYGDFDVDGDIDIHSFSGSGDNEFWRNNGSGGFEKVTGASNPFRNLPNSAAFFTSAEFASVADWDNDGDDDIFVTKRSIGNATGENIFYRNDNGTFVEVSGSNSPFKSISIVQDNQFVFGDFDADGDIDIHASNSNTATTLRFWQNDGSGNFKDVTGAENPFNNIPNNGAFFNNAKKAFVADWDNDKDADIFVTARTAADQNILFVQADAPPAISSSNPANGATGISAQADILLNFNKPVSGVAGKNITIRRVSDNAVFATIPANSAQVSGNATTAISINLTSDLAGSTGYYVQIDKGAFADVDGRIFTGITNSTTLRFTTGAAATSVTAITRTGSSPTNSAQVAYTITFANNVTGVDASDFTLSTSGPSDAFISGVSGSGTSYEVTINTGTSNGTIRLDFTGIAGTTPNVAAAFTNAEAYEIYKVSTATNYFRTINNIANWNAAESWESSADNSFWIPATIFPDASTATVTVTSGQSIALPDGFSATTGNLVNNGTINVNANVLTVSGALTNAGTLKGSGSFVNSDFNNAGTIAPGNSPGILTFNGNLTNSGVIDIELGGNTPGLGYDQIQVLGTVSFSGTLNVTLADNFTPAPGDSFTLFDATNSSGTFATVNLPVIARRLWETSYDNANGTFTIKLVNDPLPVTLVDFNVRKQETSAVLEWSSSQETNSSHFEIERSLKGQNWQLIGSVSSHSESATVRKYQFEDLQPAAGENLYRLKLVDLDGTFAYSRIRSVNFGENPIKISTYPNPAAERIFLNTKDISNISELIIYNLAGIKVRSFNQYSPEGIQLENLPAGLYLLKLQTKNGQLQQLKFVKN